MKRIIGAGLCLWGILSINAEAQIRWSDVYKSSQIQIQADPAFARGVDWGSFLFEGYKDIAVAEDGTVFMTNGREHTIHKFDPSGRLVLTFGKHGQGPGDFQGPCSPSLLDGKYLVVTEYALNRRISLFDFNGKFHKLLTTQRPVYDVAALSGNMIAYISNQFEGKDSKTSSGPGIVSSPMMVRIVLKDIESGEERVVLKQEMQTYFINGKGMPGISITGNHRRSVFMARTIEGNLAVGISDSPKIEIFDLGGKPIRSFSLDIKAVPVTPDDIDKFKKVLIDSLRVNRNMPAEVRSKIDEIGRLDFSSMFDQTHPLYQDFQTDSDGNFLFFSGWKLDSSTQMPLLDFSVFSPQGEFLTRSTLSAGAFHLAKDSFLRHLRFARTGLFGFAPIQAEEESTPYLFKANPMLPVRK